MKRQGLIDLNEAIQHPGTKLRFEVSTTLPDEEVPAVAGPVAVWGDERLARLEREQRGW